MFYKNQETSLREKYIQSLQIVGNLSNLFSDSQTPYLYYRIAEKIFCDAFDANDLSRGDIAFDAAKDGLGIGLKTFLKNNDKTLQKVAEFNKDRFLYESKSPQEIVNIVASLRNERISLAKNISGVDNSLYHCVLRSENKFFIFEEDMPIIDLSALQEIKKQKNSIWFNDGNHEYNFNLSKSTLLKRFKTDSFLEEFDVEIFENPLSMIKECFQQKEEEKRGIAKLIDTVFLPLYGAGKIVSEKSGLNQWNAAGRARDSNEIYIPIPAKVHKLAPDFFPPRDKNFMLKLPNATVLNVKVCQENSKALMSNPNKALGKWLLRDVLNLKEDVLLTYEKLQTIGIDSVRIDKYDDGNYAIHFAALGSYEEFILREII